MTVLIMAGGNGTRWTRETPKQLTALPGGETVIGRVIRQVKRFTFPYNQIAFIAKAQSIIDVAWQMMLPNYGIIHTSLLCGTLLNYLKYGDQHAPYIHILLGDTIYSAATMNAIMACDKPLAFFADVGDIYAVTFHRDSIPTLIAACETIIKRIERGDFGDAPAGKLWHLYRQVAGHDLLTHEPNFDDGLLVRVHDWTRDLDSEDHWNWFADNVLAKGLLDDVVTEVAG